jgi:hypothetical protein
MVTVGRRMTHRLARDQCWDLNRLDGVNIGRRLRRAGLPAPLRMAVRLNPLSYGVAGMRDAMSGAASGGMATDPVVLGGMAAVPLGVGSFLFSRIEGQGEVGRCRCDQAGSRPLLSRRTPASRPASPWPVSAGAERTRPTA